MKAGPDYIQFYPTLRCNKSCDFCFNRAMPSVPDMTFEHFRRMLAVLKHRAVSTIDIIGGEPTLHPEIVTFVRAALRAGFFVNISSNGTNLNMLEEIMSLGSRVTVGISVNDRETLNQARSFIKKHKPLVKSIFNHNMDGGTIKEILSLKPKKYYLIYRDALSRSELQTTVPFPQFTSTIEQEFNATDVGTVFCSGFVPDTERRPDLAQARCPAGTAKLGIMPDGSVYPCNLFFGKKEFLLGNILSVPFSEIWQHQALAYFRSTAANACPQGACPHHVQCHGGCPALSLLLTNNLFAPDPRCNEIRPYLSADR
jgi:radical SAM protein with 4Fe4S-binding SPASM domain